MNNTWRLCTLWRHALAFILVVVALFLLARYPGEWRLARANALVEATLLGKIDPAQRHKSMTEALRLLETTTWQMPHDPRRELVSASALTVLGRGAEARDALLPEVIRAERPELVVALGRAYAAAGDDVRARAAFLRAAWAAPTSLSTLPKAVREDLLRQVAVMESLLAAGQLHAPPPLPSPGQQ